MQISFDDISERCYRLLNKVNDPTIRRLYFKFSFKYLNCSTVSYDETNFKNFLLNSLNKYRFFTYDFNPDLFYLINFPQVSQSSKIKSSTNNIDVLFCTEDACFIIQQINQNFFQNILKEIQSIFINVNQNSENKLVLEEIMVFCNKFSKSIKNNLFVKKTISSIVGYIIRRYFYPSDYFIDKSFFKFDNINNLIDERIQENFQKLSKTKLKKEIANEIKEIQNDAIEIAKYDSNKFPMYEFQEKDFIQLRPLHSNIYLALHLESLYLLAIKFINPLKFNENEHEITFVRNYSHRSILKFYGFVKKNNDIKGLVYEFMSNGSLSDYFASNSQKINIIFSFMAMARIFNGIQYLHSNHLIHRDIKPSNILLNHDFIPFISDFEYVRSIENIDPKKPTNFTYDFASFIYASPEQFYESTIDYSTDIYSFGLVVYFLFEKKDIVNIKANDSAMKYQAIYEQIAKDDIPKITNVSAGIQYIYLSCVKFKSQDRIKLNTIRNKIKEEIYSFDYFEKYLTEISVFDEKELFNYLLENLIFLIENKYDFNKYDEMIFNPQLLSVFSSNYIGSFEKTSKIFLFIGNLFYNGDKVKKDIPKAIKYYELSAKQNNPKALNNLGNLYSLGIGVQKDNTKAKEYFELAGKYNEPSALNNLGVIYYFGYGVPLNYIKAKEYFELSAKLKNSKALVHLGDLYYNGFGVKQDYQKAKEYYELSANLNDPSAFNNLGKLYYFGFGVEKNYEKAKEYFEISAKKNNNDAVNNLGIMYYKGFGVNKDFHKAREYFELAAKRNHPDSLYNLGNLYYNGFGVKKDYHKAREYFELSAKQNNSKGILQLGNIYYDGNGVKKDCFKAKEYYELAAKLNNSDAINCLGILYIKGQCVDQNYSKAKEFFELASKLNNSDAFLNLGILYFNGLGVEQNYLKAKEYFELSAQLNNLIALLNLGSMYYAGLGVEQNFLKAKYYYELFHQNKKNDFFEIITRNCSSFINKNLCQFQDLFGLLYNPKNYFFETIYDKNFSEDLLENISYFISKIALKEENNFFMRFLSEFKDYIKLMTINFNNIDFKNILSKFSIFFEMTTQINDFNSLNALGLKYYFGLGVEKDYMKAKNCFEQSAKQNNSLAFLNLGSFYKNGIGIEKDYLRANCYYEISAHMNNSIAMNKLGELYKKGIGVKQDYKKSKEYFELSAHQNDSDGFYNLGKLYFKGQGIDKNFKKAKEYFEIAAKKNNYKAFLILGNIYLYGLFGEKDNLKAKNYFELASLQSSSKSFFHLADLYSSGEFFEIDLNKAIQYYKKCIEIQNDTVLVYKVKDDSILPEYRYNKYKHRSNNDLGIIFIINFNDIEEGEKYLKEAAFAEYPHGQNNFGLLSQFFLNKKENAEYMYERSSKNSFALAYYNLGYLKEKEEKIEESIEYYKKASENENHPLIFHNHKHYDKRLDISKTFIISFANLKLCHYHLSKSDYEESKKYFIKSFTKFISFDKRSLHQIQLGTNPKGIEKEFLSFFKSLIFNYPLFNFKNQTKYHYLISQNLFENESKRLLNGISNEKQDYSINQSVLHKLYCRNDNYFQLFKKSHLKDFEIQNEINKINFVKDSFTSEKVDTYKNNENETGIKKKYSLQYIDFEDLNELFDFIIQYKEALTDSIGEILEIMEKILYTPPYDILFGRICIEQNNAKQKQDENLRRKNISSSFYEGFEFY